MKTRWMDGPTNNESFSVIILGHIRRINLDTDTDMDNESVITFKCRVRSIPSSCLTVCIDVSTGVTNTAVRKYVTRLFIVEYYPSLIQPISEVFKKENDVSSS